MLANFPSASAAVAVLDAVPADTRTPNPANAGIQSLRKFVSLSKECGPCGKNPKAARRPVTARDWLVCEDARKLVVWLRGIGSDRKFRLFACAFWRWDAERPSRQTELDRALAYVECWAETGSRPPDDSGLVFPTGF